ncbi:hypothetical protein glysoja_006169 [Glycine soja]|nr:hypothetical protein glysoja_006169 [Glycine soja]
MEILSYGSGPCSQAVDSKWKLVDKCLNSRQSRFPSVGNGGVYYTNTISRSGSVRFHDTNKELQRDFGSLSALEGSKRTNCKAYSESCDGYVIGGEEDVADIAGVEEPATNKVVIPGLPDGSNGAPISSCFWEWKPKLNVYYEKAGCENVDSPHVLFLPGFGVGSFHYEKQLRDLGRDTRVWALDFLGQGLSLPFEDPAPHYNKEGVTSDGNASSWGFGDETEPWATKLVIGEPVYIVGNSLMVTNPMASLVMLGRWEKISDPASIAEVLNQVYAENSTNVDSVFSRIIETTRHPAAAAAFASIMFAPRAELSFSEALSGCRKSNVPICLMYGKEDPWVRPLWGHQVKRQVPEASYYQISPAGHCPHDEVPEVINFLLRGWIRNLESEGSISLPLLEGLDSLKQANARELEFIREGSTKSVMVRFYESTFSLWDRIRSYINHRSKLRNSATKSQ